MTMPVTIAMTAATVVVTVITPAVAAIVITTVPVAAVITVTAATPAITAIVVAHEINRLPACAVLRAIACPVLGVAGGHTHVDGALVNGHRNLLDDDRLGVDQRGLLVADVDTAIKTGLGHADADADIGGAGPGTLAAQGCQAEGGKTETKGAAKREVMR